MVRLRWHANSSVVEQWVDHHACFLGLLYEVNARWAAFTGMLRQAQNRFIPRNNRSLDVFLSSLPDRHFPTFFSGC